MSYSVEVGTLLPAYSGSSLPPVSASHAAVQTPLWVVPLLGVGWVGRT